MINYGFLPFSAYVVSDFLVFHRNRSISLEILLRQIRFTGVEALGLVMLIALLIGALIIVQGYPLLSSIGQVKWTYAILISTIVRDLGPFIVCFVVLARSGTAITTELGNMVVRKEIDALIAMGVSPISYLVAPRVLGMVASLILLMSYFVACGIFGGYLVSNAFASIPVSTFFAKLMAQLHWLDMVIMLAKVAFSGLMISLIASYHGLTVKSAITEVPQRNIKAVGRGLIALCVIHVLFTLLYFALMGDW
ncbi:MULTISPECIES: ABC transporter permease [Pseudoalteromonas]|uniref:ABC transporter permease n=1 Tax=Pseudoalteromonas TaxID=53246 RepID=UPI000F78E7DC|nr:MULTISPECIES: ABC transporter permease [Pseudoalteromonas]MCF2910747.1 ABC transporter permease [Pseudoalteromonas sp. DL2-H2.2]